jgi:hypothetical protein
MKILIEKAGIYTHGSHVAVIQIIHECLTNGYTNSTDSIMIYQYILVVSYERKQMVLYKF